MTDNPQSGFLSPKFGLPPEEAESWTKTQQWVDHQPRNEDWESMDDEIEEFVAQLLGRAENRIEKERQVELGHIRSINEGRDSLLRQLEMAWNLEQLGFVTKRFHALISKGERLAESAIHMRSGLLDAVNRANGMYNTALQLARHRLESKQAQEDDAREQRRLQQQKADQERKEREESRRKVREESDRRWQEETERRNRLHQTYFLDYCHRCSNPKPRGHLYCCDCYYHCRRRRW